MTKNRTMNVVTFRPPAVPAEPPPTNISMMVPSRVSSRDGPVVPGVEAGGAGLDRVEPPPSSFSAGARGPSVPSLAHSVSGDEGGAADEQHRRS